MTHRIVPAFAVLFAILIIGTMLVPGLWEPVAARQASPTAGTPCPATSEKENAALVRRYLEVAYNGRNPALADELLADDFVRHNAASPHRNQARATPMTPPASRRG
jgi:hypothetical protein